MNAERLIIPGFILALLAWLLWVNQAKPPADGWMLLLNHNRMEETHR